MNQYDPNNFGRGGPDVNRGGVTTSGRYVPPHMRGQPGDGVAPPPGPPPPMMGYNAYPDPNSRCELIFLQIISFYWYIRMDRSSKPWWLWRTRIQPTTTLQ